MTVQTRMSAKGQVVIPKQVRDRMKLSPGDALDIIERPDGMLLRAAKEKTGESFAQVTARIRALVNYDGPIVSIEDMDDTITRQWTENATRRGDRARD